MNMISYNYKPKTTSITPKLPVLLNRRRFISANPLPSALFPIRSVTAPQPSPLIIRSLATQGDENIPSPPEKEPVKPSRKITSLDIVRGVLVIVAASNIAKLIGPGIRNLALKVFKKTIVKEIRIVYPNMSFLNLYKKHPLLGLLVGVIILGVGVVLYNLTK